MATTLYGALLGLWLVILSLRVIALRGGPVMGWLKFGYTGEHALTRSIRAQGNLIGICANVHDFDVYCGIGRRLFVFAALLWRFVFVGPFDAWHLHGVHGEKRCPALRRYHSYTSATFGHFRFAADAAVVG